MTHYSRAGSQALDRSTNPRRGTVGNYVGAYTPPRLIAPVLGSYGLGDDAKRAQMAEAKAAAVARFGTKASSQVSAARISADRVGISLAKPASAPAVVDAKGKIVVPTASFWSDWNKSAAQLMSPVAPALIAVLGPVTGRRLVTAPLDAMMDIFDPIEDAVGRAVDRVLAKKGNVQNYFGTMRNMKRVQPADLKADATTQNLMRRFRTIDAFIVLFFTQPIDLAIEMGKEGIDIAGKAAQAVGKAAEDLGRAVGQGAAAVAEGARQATHEVASWFGLGAVGGFGGLSGFGGLGATGADDAAAGAAVVATPVGGGVMDGILDKVIKALVDFLGKEGEKVALGFVEKGAQMMQGPGTPPSSAPPAPVPSAPPPPPEKEGLSPIVLVGGAALLAVLLLRK